MKESRKFLYPAIVILLLAGGSINVAAQTEERLAGMAEMLQNVAVVKPSPRPVLTVGPELSAETPNATPSAPERSLLTRVGVQSQDSLALSLDDAIRMALENNNNIELTRDDVRFQETQIRAISGSYDPVVTVSPTYTRNSTTGGTPTNDFNVNSSVNQLLRTGGNYTGFFNNSRTENAFAQAQVSSGSLTGGTSAIYSSSYGIRFNQPLMRNLGIDSTRRN